MSCVYVFKAVGTFDGKTLYKVGQTSFDSPDKRLQQVSSGLIPFASAEICASWSFVTVKDACNIESFLHKVFDDMHVEGEWFDFGDGCISLIDVCTSDELIRDRKSTRLNSSHIQKSRMPSSA